MCSIRGDYEYTRRADADLFFEFGGALDVRLLRSAQLDDLSLAQLLALERLPLQLVRLDLLLR